MQNSTGCERSLRRGPGYGAVWLGRGSGSKGTSSLADATDLELGALVLPSYAGIHGLRSNFTAPRPRVWSSLGCLGRRGTSSLADAAGLELGALVLPSYAGIARVAEQLHCTAARMEQFGLGRGSGSKGTSKLSRRRRLGARGLRSAALVSCRYRQVLPSFLSLSTNGMNTRRVIRLSLLTRPSTIAPWRLHDPSVR